MTLRPDHSLWKDFIHSKPFLNAIYVPLGVDGLLVDNTRTLVEHGDGGRHTMDRELE